MSEEKVELSKVKVLKKNPLKRAVLWISFAFLLLLLLSSILGPALQKSVLKSNGPLGELYEVNGHMMHLYCNGQGDETVVLNADILGGTLSWKLLQDNLSRDTRVCSYDRAGIAWSEESNQEETVATMAEDLNLLLSEAGEAGPYFLVGHGFGGSINRMFLSKYPEAVSAFILLDSQARDLMQLFFPDNLAEIEKLDQVNYGKYKNTELLAQLGLLRLLPGDKPDYLHLEAYPEDIRDLWKAVIHRGYWDTVLKEYRIFQESKNELSNEPLLLGEKPMVVFASDYMEEEWPVFEDIDMKNLYDMQLEAQKELLRLSYNNTLVVFNGTGHDIPRLATEEVQKKILSILDELENEEEEVNEDGANSDLVEIEI